MSGTWMYSVMDIMYGRMISIMVGSINRVSIIALIMRPILEYCFFFSSSGDVLYILARMTAIIVNAVNSGMKMTAQVRLVI
ncbi:MAG: hypothetical protein KAU03_03435 [Candidatus Altiarchaeales archaeon]|nr:hypothetical protein [Candidatus Altiarchaeales archaeon]